MTHDKTYAIIKSVQPRFLKNTNSKNQHEYDENSNRTRITDQNGHTTRTIFDEMNRPVKSTDPLGNSEIWVYDQMGNVTAHTDKNGLTETRAYDALSRLTKKQKGDIEITQTYDALGNMTAIEDQSGKITVTYNPVGFIESVTDQNENATYYKYDPAGHLIKRSDLAGSTQYHYDNNAVTQIAFIASVVPTPIFREAMIACILGPKDFNQSLPSSPPPATSCIIWEILLPEGLIPA